MRFARYQFAVLTLLLAAIGRAAAPVSPNEIIVSAANYAEASPNTLVKLFHHPVDLRDAPPPPPSNHPVRYYQFLRSEPLDADLSYEDVCRLLSPVLAAKNFVNTADKAKVELILRVTFGGRRWRDPMVRENDLGWEHGLVPKRRTTALSAASIWDERAGGDELALYRLERDLAETNPGAEGMADSLIGGIYTEDYYLIVVDAFEVATLRKKGNDTPRVWSTFIAVPRQKGVRFSDVAARMVTKAAPYFGETLPGKAHFTDREGNVEIRDLRVIEEEEKSDVPKK